VIEASDPLKLRRDGPREHHIRAGAHGQMEVRLLGRLDAPWIDHHQLGAIALGSVDLPHEMQIAAGGVVAPDDDELRETDLLERCAGCCAESAGVGGAADPAAQGTSAQQRGADPMKETQRHGITRQHPVRAGVVERQQRLRTVAADDLAYARVNGVQCLIPGDSLELVGTFLADTFQRVAQAVVAVHKFWVVIGHFGANGTVGDGIDFRTAHGDQLVAGNRHREAAGIRTIQGADAALVYVHVDWLHVRYRQINSTSAWLNSRKHSCLLSSLVRSMGTSVP
jgi:hypothetical protein